MLEDDQEERIQKHLDIYEGNPNMLAAALVASEELRDLYKSQVEEVRANAGRLQDENDKLRAQVTARGRKVARLQQALLERASTYYREAGEALPTGNRELKAEVEKLQQLLVSKVAECDDWKRRYEDLYARVASVRNALDTAPVQSPPAAPASSTSSTRSTPALAVVDIGRSRDR
ncbi:MAG: hypothetical protein AB7Q97_10960 [Gammaproteobacteria bacterium]